VLAIVARVRGPRWLLYLCKPLATGSLALDAAFLSPADPVYRTLVVAGLLCSLVGDIFLMLPPGAFTAGLGSFLMAHLLYAGAFGRTVHYTASLPLLLPFLLAGAALLTLVWPGLGRQKPAVLVYVAVIVMMAWMGAGRWWVVRSDSAELAAAGGLLFMVSDGALAWNRFRRPYAGAQPLILGTYWLAQFLIARSVAGSL